MTVKKHRERVQAVIDYSLNRFMPWVIIGLIVFASFGGWDWRPYTILGLLAFVERNCYNLGYSICFCKERKLVEFNDGSDA